MIAARDTELGSEVKLTPTDEVQSVHLQHLPHPHSGFSNSSIDFGPKFRVSCGDHKMLNSSAIVEIEAENAHFQPSAWDFLTTKHSRRFANDVALALREKIAAGMEFSSRKPPLS